MFVRGETVVRSGDTQPMTLVKFEQDRRGRRLAVCEWHDQGRVTVGRFLEDELELYFPPRTPR